MKKAISRISAVAIAIIATGVIWKSHNTLRENKRGTADIQALKPLPFCYIKAASESLDRPVIINYFSPGCEHCQHMAGEVGRYAFLFQQTHFVMISAAGKEATNLFIKRYNLDTLRFLSVGLDTLNAFRRYFNTSMVPSFFIYDKNLQLRKAIYGETRVENIYETIN